MFQEKSLPSELPIEAKPYPIGHPLPVFCFSTPSEWGTNVVYFELTALVPLLSFNVFEFQFVFCWLLYVVVVHHQFQLTGNRRAPEAFICGILKSLPILNQLGKGAKVVVLPEVLLSWGVHFTNCWAVLDTAELI